jgi:Nuclease-related domain
MTLATVYPREMPSWIRRDPLRSAECKVYDVLKAQLNQPYVLFYSRPWLGLTKDGREIDGEADFVIAHRELGILVLEVKGGEIRYDACTDVWTSTDRYRIVHRIKNPVYQAKSSKYQILEKLRSAGDCRQGRIRARHAVIFPDCERSDMDLAADMPLSICAFLEDMQELGGWVSRRMSPPPLRETGEVPLGEHGIAVLETLLSRPFQLHTPLGHILEQEEEQIVLLTDEQFQILDGFESYRRLAVAGGAGTGKTALAYS